VNCFKDLVTMAYLNRYRPGHLGRCR